MQILQILHLSPATMSVIMFDLETTGLPSRDGLKFGEYHDYTDISKYDEARIVQVSYMVCDTHLNPLSMHDAIIASKGEFLISNSHIHGITDARSDEFGRDFNDVMVDFDKALREAGTLVAHNADFDINVLKSELFRRHLTGTLDELCTKRVVCSMKASKLVVNATNAYNRPKFPTLKELYVFATNKPMLGAHNARHDVLNMHEAVKSLADRGLLRVC